VAKKADTKPAEEQRAVPAEVPTLEAGVVADAKAVLPYKAHRIN
jgi:hypothetical protein